MPQPPIFTRLLTFLAATLLAFVPPEALAAGETVRIMAANLTSGDYQAYQSQGIRIFQGLDPDIVLIQEFNYQNNSSSDIRKLVDTAFGSDFYYFRGAGSLPNGIVSRYPIKASGEWNDPEVSNREFAYARIDVPGDVDLWAISLHLLTSSSSDRDKEAKALVNFIKANVPAKDLLVLGGDLNTGDGSEACIKTLAQVVVTSGPFPVDQKDNRNTNASRSKPYDWVLADSDLHELKTAVKIGGSSYANGLVFDSRVYTPLSEVSPVQYNDSGADSMQHMGVVRDFLVASAEDQDGDGYSAASGDCDDSDPDVNPGELEVADGADNDCDGTTDEGTDRFDDDGDGFSEDEGDCDDGDEDLHPGATERADGVDNDCDGRIDEGTTSYDDDGDGFSEKAGDCDDTNPARHPNAPEVVDGIDNDCDGTVDEGQLETPSPTPDEPVDPTPTPGDETPTPGDPSPTPGEGGDGPGPADGTGCSSLEPSGHRSGLPGFLLILSTGAWTLGSRRRRR